MEILRDSSKISIGWGVAVVGAMGFLIRFAAEGKHGLSRGELALGELAMVSAVVSIFFGHMSLNVLLHMLASDIYSLADSALLRYERLQYLFLLISLLALVVYVHCVFERYVDRSAAVGRADPEVQDVCS